jgi:arylsulfatase A-like enzyme
MNAETPSHMHGHSLVNALRGARPAMPDDCDCAIIETSRAVGIRTPTHLYGLPFVESTRQLAGAPDMFFDLAADPYQLHNLAGTREQVEVAQDLDRRLREWDARTPWMENVDTLERSNVST